MARRTASEPDWSGMCSCGHHVRRLRHGGDDVVSEVPGVRRGEAHPLEPVDLAAGAQQLGEREPVPERGPVGVDVLPQQRDLEHPVVDQRPDLGEHVAGPAVLLAAAQAGHDAERAGVVAADRDRDPGRVRGLAPGGQDRRKPLERLGDLDLGFVLDPGAFEQRGQRADVVRAEHHVDPRGPVRDHGAVLLRQAAADGDLHAGVSVLDRQQVTEVAVQPVVGVLAHGAGVEDHDVGLGAVGGLR